MSWTELLGCMFNMHPTHGSFMLTSTGNRRRKVNDKIMSLMR